MATGNNIQHYPLNRSIVLYAKQELKPDFSQIELAVDVVWEKMTQKNPKLYNGSCFCLHDFNESKIIGSFIPYKFFAVQKEAPELFSSPIRALGVSGLTLFGDTILIGRRASSVLLYPNYYECIPSGSIEKRFALFNEVDFCGQILSELQEEAAITEKMVKEIYPIALFYSPEEHLYDIGLVLRLDVQQRESEYLIRETEEYQSLDWVPIKEFRRLYMKNSASFLPLSWVMYTVFEKDIFLKE